MEGRQAFIGVIIFAVVAIAIFIICHELLGLREAISVMLALAIGFIVELIYQRSKRKGQ